MVLYDGREGGGGFGVGVVARGKVAVVVRGGLWRWIDGAAHSYRSADLERLACLQQRAPAYRATGLPVI